MSAEAPAGRVIVASDMGTTRANKVRLSFTQKLLLVLLLTNAILVGGMALAAHWSFQKGFLRYLTEVEMQRLDPMARALAQAYDENGGWDFLRDNPQAWRSYCPRLPAAIRPPPPGGPPGMGPPGAGFGGPPGAPDFGPRRGAPPQATITRRLSVLDAAGRHVFGPPPPADAVRRPLRLDGRTVGFLVLAPLPWPKEAVDQGFRDRQLVALYWIAGGALLLALLIALPVARHLLAPVRAIARGARELASGHYDTRIAVDTRDELGRLAADFNALADALARNETLRRQGMADVSHELRTPISLLQAEIEAIQDGVRPCNAERLQALHAATVRLSALVGDLYDLALADAGALSYRKEELDLAELATAAVDAARAAAAARGLTLESQLPGTLPLFADPKRLRQVLDNLLKNALRYTDPGGRVTVRAGQRGRTAWLEVADSAPGVAPELLPRLFDRFYRVEGSRDRARGGAGLGLAICRNIVEAHGGTITAQASPLGGVAIRVELPLDDQ